jgi:glycosyltransferase involved in cell wall biosynthesis
MTDILVNALSVTNQSGLHVLAGHLDSLAEAFTVAVIARPSMTSLKERFAERVEWIGAPENTSRWLPRAVWEFQALEKIARNTGARFYFTPSGISASRLSIPQVVLCQNPWALVPAARRKKDALKAWLQRRAYRQTMRAAEVMVFNSEYMRQAYRRNAGFDEKRSIIAYQAADEETRRRSEDWKDRPRAAGQILCVSAMAPHKNVEAVVRALVKLPEATLRLVGAWPDSRYERKIHDLVSELNLEKRIRFDGFVSREELDRLYAESQVFCLMSRCESFGIPAIEAQLFGTPVVCSKVCAVTEICGEGGLFCDPDDVDAIAGALRALLEGSNDRNNKEVEAPPPSKVWEKISDQTRVNADRFQWSECSRPLVEFFAERGAEK